MDENLLRMLMEGESDDRPDANDEAVMPDAFCTISEANNRLQELMLAGKEGAPVRAVAEAIERSPEISGTADEFHNIIQDFFRVHDCRSAFIVANKGLGLFPGNVDLLANAIRSAAGLADFESCDRFEATARGLGLEYWNWRIFVFLIDAYKTRIGAQTSKELRMRYYERAHGIADEYLGAFPADDRAYNAKAELFLLANETAKAKAVLNKAIGAAKTESGERILAPTCCITYLDILEPTDEASCNLIIKVARKGIHSTAQEQPSANIGYFLYREALALDALIAMKDDGKGYSVEEDVKRALDCYECAYELLKDRSYARTIKERYSILRNKGKGDFADRELPE